MNGMLMDHTRETILKLALCIMKQCLNSMLWRLFLSYYCKLFVIMEWENSFQTPHTDGQN